MSDALQKKLSVLDKDTLIEIISEIYLSGKDGKKLITTLLNIRDPKAMHKEFKKDINAIKRGKRFIDYRSMPDFIERLFSISEKMEKYILPLDPNLTLDLCKQLIEIDGSLFERVDDSNGELGSFYYRLFEILDKALGASNESAESVVAYIMEIALKDDYGNRSTLPDQLHHCLKEDVMACFEACLEVKSRSELEIQVRNTSWDEVHKNLASLSILKKIADKKNDIDEYIRLSQLGMFDERSICQIAKRLNAAFRTEEAIVWLNAIDSPNLFREKSQLLQEAYRLEGDQEKERQVIWEQFTRDMGVSDYLTYLKMFPDVDKDEIKKKAYQIAVENSVLERGLKFLWDLGDYKMVEQTYFKRVGEVNERSFSFYRKLSSALYQNGHPLAAVVMRRSLIEQVLRAGTSKYYRYAISDLNQMEKYSEDVKEWKGVSNNSEYLNALYDEHYRKYSFWDQVDYLLG
ncbi:DUF6880 family protein [Vibrio hyugaensis]|uniref:DUF6880 family protein n=1 Tax=Vibrio hyugaensis TaxID=1534743 RepID=UPI0005ED59E0|nr:DUF6880 family protein [Vibrio hyugaensis]